LSEQVVAELEALIASEFSQPGTRLPKEDELAERFRVSRIVIREAMKILEDRGLVEVRAGRGTTVVAPSPDRVKSALARLFRDQPIPTSDDMEHMIELRGVLEETVAGLAAIRATPEDLEKISQALSEMAATESTVEQTSEADVRFHMAMAAASHNRFFEIVLEPLTAVYLQQVKLTNSYEIGIDQHRQIYERIAKGDQVGARQAVRRLMEATRKHVKAALQVLAPDAR
jgi:DNA-binding FadR family transcriptional regulator